MLSWQTATEINNFGFEILRADESKVYLRIGTIRGNGTITDILNLILTLIKMFRPEPITIS